MGRVWKCFDSGIKSISEICGYICNIIIFILSVIIFYEVVVRYLFVKPTIWTTEISQYFLAALCFLGASYALKHKGHIMVDLFVSRLSSRTRNIFDAIVGLAALLFCAVLGWQGYLLWYEALTLQFTSETILTVPLWIVYIVFPIGMFLLCLQYVTEIIDGITKFVESSREF